MSERDCPDEMAVLWAERQERLRRERLGSHPHCDDPAHPGCSNCRDRDEPEAEKVSHTPGPWEASEWHDEASGMTGWSLVAGGYLLPMCDGETNDIEEARANARLAASAPELLEALQRLSAQCDRMRLPGQTKSDAERNAAAAIAKATGEQA